MPTSRGPEDEKSSICVVIPAYEVSKHILGVLSSIGPEVGHILVVDDCCPEKSGDLVEARCADERVEVIRHTDNLGVGGAVMTGYRRALQLKSDVIVKIDGDGQMNPALIPRIVQPILRENADYAKGNRFFNVEHVRAMPLLRILGNLVLSLFAKATSGYWNVFDPNNGDTANSGKVAARLPLEKITSRYFFEPDMLFRLNLLGAGVVDVPMNAIYGDETSNLRLFSSVFEFPGKHLRNLFKSTLYSYYLREFNLASIELPLGLGLVSLGLFLGVKNWIHSMNLGITTQTGTLILIAMSVLAGLQLLLGFFPYGIANVPKDPISRWLEE